MNNKPENQARRWTFGGGEEPDLSNLSDADFEKREQADTTPIQDGTSSIVPFKQKGRFDDDTAHLPRLRLPTRSGDIQLIITSGKGDRVITELDKNMGSLVAAEGINLGQARHVMVFPARLGITGLSLAALYPATDFSLYDPDARMSDLTAHNISLNYLAVVGSSERHMGNIRALKATEPAAAEQSYDAVVYEPQPFVGSETIRVQIELAHRVLQDQGSLFTVTHKNFGAQAQLEMMADVFQYKASEEYVGRGGYRILKAIKQQGWDEHASTGSQVEINVLGLRYSVYSEAGLFSRTQMDNGTRFLLEHAFGNPGNRQFRRLLDVGGGWGAIGLTAAQLNPHGEVVMIDNDSRASLVATQNARRLGLTNVVCVTTDNMMRDVNGNFDLILSNPPFHAETGVLEGLLKGMRDKLEKRGSLYMVVEKSYADKFIDLGRAAFGNLRTEKETRYGNTQYVILSTKK